MVRLKVYQNWTELGKCWSGRRKVIIYSDQQQFRPCDRIETSIRYIGSQWENINVQSFVQQTREQGLGWYKNQTQGKWERDCQDKRFKFQKSWQRQNYVWKEN